MGHDCQARVAPRVADKLGRRLRLDPLLDTQAQEVESRIPGEPPFQSRQNPDPFVGNLATSGRKLAESIRVKVLRMVSQADESYALCFRKVSKSLEGIMPIVGVTAMHVNNAYARRHR